jgi:DNA polymerase-3 subunit delta
VKANKKSIGPAVDQPDAKVRFYLFHGPDEGQSRAMAGRLLAGLGASKFAVSGAAVKADPAMLVDEASAMSLFGGRRAIWIEPASNDIEEAAAAFLDGPQPESPVVAIAGTLTKASALLKLAEGSPLALAYASYVPEGADAQRMVIDLGRRVGLKIALPLATRLAETCANDEAVVSQELAKLALYVDASPHSPKELDEDAIDAVGAGAAEGNVQRLGDLALQGALAELAAELSGLAGSASEAVPMIRSVQRRLSMLAPLRARVERGEGADAVMASAGKPLFWKDKAMIQKMLARWSATDLARIADRLGALERELMRPRARPESSMPEQAALGEELLAIAHRARARRA